MAVGRILTPDRRLRVFVSSTLRELALERVTAREAISSLRLAPVLFEQGARPHPPRDLYAAYVEQCDVFVAIYWQSYGWVAPGTTISGIEDEFELAQGKPMLLYVKEPSPERDDALSALIRRIEAEAGSAYRPFATTEELHTLVTDDLALLLTERFHGSAEEEERSGLPARTTSFVGRERELGELLRLVERDDVRLVTLTGPGGIGKTRLAIEAGRLLAPRFSDGVAYVALDRLADPDLVPTAIAEAIGLSSLGPDPEAGLARRLHDRQLLLVLDNFEHVLAAAPFVTRLLEAAGGLEVLATSREPLRLRGEHEYGVPPLEDAPRLFRERVGAVRPGAVWDDENMRAVDEICRRVDGLPLAVELVAAGARMLPPRVLVEHLGSSLDALAVGRRDAPARQQTVRATIDWSYGLLTGTERDLFERLGAFDGSFTIEAARAVAAEDGPAVLSTLSALVDKSLLLHAASESETRFRMLHVVTEYAAERLADRPDAGAVATAHSTYYEVLARAASEGLRSREQRGWKDVLDLERENLRGALSHLVGVGLLDEAAEIVWSVLPYWLTGRLLEGRKAAEELLAASTGELSNAARARMRVVDGLLAALLTDIATAPATLEEAIEFLRAYEDDEGTASALAGLGIATAPTDPDRARAHLVESAKLFAKLDDAWGEAMVLGALGWLDTGRGDFTDESVFERAYALAREVEDDVATAHAATNLAELRLARERPAEASDSLHIALDAHEAVRLYDGLAYGLEVAARIAWTADRLDDAACLLAAAAALREEVDIPIWGARLTRFETLVSSVRDRLDDETFASRSAEGRALDFDGAVEAARRVLDASAATVQMPTDAPV